MLISPESLAILGGAIALAGGLAGSSIGIGWAGSAGAAILADDPKQLRNVIVLAALPMTQTFYGLIILIIILTTVMPRVAEMGAGYGFAVLGIGVIAAAAEVFSAAYQGAVCASGISLLTKTKGRIFTNTIMLAVMIELFGVLGLVFTIMALSMIGVM
ncbi:MAG: V-type sodium ATPase subunit K [Dehalococcoidia bacterium]|nr:V-type sodium ATPase subunit K [Chloroflexota bacterium]MBT9162338.1 V-type sodium ATPase subunit K [Chloroflexota bacterium]